MQCCSRVFRDSCGQITNRKAFSIEVRLGFLLVKYPFAAVTFTLLLITFLGLLIGGLSSMVIALLEILAAKMFERLGSFESRRELCMRQIGIQCF